MPLSVRKLLLLGVFTTLAFGANAQEQTKIGSTTTYCASPLVVGSTKCGSPAPEEAQAKRPEERKSQPKRQVAEPPRSDQVVGGVKESQIDEFLANHGKPSRTAIRAILNPTDENLAAVMNEEQAQMAVAHYSGVRRAELLAMKKKGDIGPELPAADLPHLMGLKLTIVTDAKCVGCSKLLPIVQQLLTEFPAIDARVGVVGEFDVKEFLALTTAAGAILPTSQFSLSRARQLAIKKLPSIVVGDSRFGTINAIGGSVQNALELEVAMVQIRKRNQMQSRAQSQVEGATQ